MALRQKDHPGLIALLCRMITACRFSALRRLTAFRSRRRYLPSPVLFLGLLACLVFLFPTLTPEFQEPPPYAPGRGSWQFETLGTQIYSLAGQTRRVEMIRARYGTLPAHYLIYIPGASSNAPVVISNEAYEGIDWSGEAVDQRWAQRGSGYYADAEAPNFNGVDKIPYALVPIASAVNSASVWVANGYAVVLTFARFYAGGTLDDEIMDAVAPYYFLASRSSQVDTTRIGVIGGSWGGMMALFGAAYAPAALAPKVVSAMSPPSDLEQMWRYADYLPMVFPAPDAAREFFSPYLRRIGPTTGGEPGKGDFNSFTQATLCGRLRAKILVAHDEWDTIIPVDLTRQLVAACPDRIQPLYWRRQSAPDYARLGIDHGPFGSDGPYPAAYSFTSLWLIKELSGAGQTQTVMASDISMRLYLRTVHDAQRAGSAASDSLLALRMMSATEVMVSVTGRSGLIGGANYLAPMVNAEWGTSYNATSLRNRLSIGLPPP